MTTDLQPETAHGPLPRNIAQITPDWLTNALQPTGILSGARVIAVAATRIGADESFTGGNLFRLALSCQGGTGTPPQSLVAKLSPSDPDLAVTLDLANRREVQFYQGLSNPAAHAVPHCHYARHDPAGPASLILMDDLGAYRHVPFLDGCTETEARAVVAALARLHATWWNAPDLHRMITPAPDPSLSFRACWAQYPKALAAILDGATLPDAMVALGDHIAEHETAIFTKFQNTGPLTLVHRDVHADNILFGTKIGQQDVILIDWQMTGSGHGIHDLGYFLISSVPVSERRRIEMEMVSLYHSSLQVLGITDCTLGDCRADYLMSFVGKFWLSVAATVLLDASTPHKRAWRRADLSRLIAFVQDHNLTPAMFVTG